jgi:hypothetical protein
MPLPFGHLEAVFYFRGFIASESAFFRRKVDLDLLPERADIGAAMEIFVAGDESQSLD